MRWDDGTFRPWPWTLVVNGPSTQTFRYASQDQFVPILPAYSNEFEISFDSAYQGSITSPCISPKKSHVYLATSQCYKTFI